MKSFITLIAITSVYLSCILATRQRQQGFTLVELMIALILGLVVLSAVINSYTGSARSSRFTEGLQQMQENGRYGVSVLQKGLRLAGYSPDRRIAPLDFSAGDENTVVVHARQALDCNGLSTKDSDGLAINTYRLDSINNQITCEGNNVKRSIMPIVEGVDGFRLLYGIDNDGDDVPERYVPYKDDLDPMLVSSVRFALLVNSGQPIRTRETREVHVLLDEEMEMTDRVARNVFSSTVKLRNRR